MHRIVVTGGAGFIGSALIRHLISDTDVVVLNIDKLTYSGNLNSLNSVKRSDRYQFLHADIADKPKIAAALENFRPDAILNLAAETHVDRSIDYAEPFITTNIVGTYHLLEAARAFWGSLDAQRKQDFRFHHISTDEVYGSLGDSGLFTETTAYDPRSPYSSSKAASDHLVKAWTHTYGLPVIITNCSNNFGPFQFPEKLIPLVILNALEEKPLPIYGDGKNVRDWLYVDDHAKALFLAVRRGKIGETYNIGGDSERTNLQVVEAICEQLDSLKPRKNGDSYKELIEFVQDRAGHDRRYAIDASKAKNELGWHAQETFQSGLKKTVDWYLHNSSWWRPIRDKTYSGSRLGVVNKHHAE